MNKEELKKLLDYYDDLYYNHDKSEISDEEYDNIKKQYLNAENIDEYNYVPGSAVTNEYKHENPVLSLGKIQITDTVGLYENISNLYPIVIEPKFDGLTVVAYDDNTFVTRGNGYIGEDISDKCKQIECLKNLHSNKYPLRMEVFMPISEFDSINTERIQNGLEPYENTRNTAAGMLRNLDVKKIKGLSAAVYEVIGDTSKHSESLDNLNINFTTPRWIFNDKNKENGVKKAVEFIQNFDRAVLDYDIDGLVIKSDIEDSLNVFGSTGHHPKNAIAVKFKPQGEWTKLKSVTWQVGKEGIITPVGEIEPVRIMGSVITRVTLHNIGIIKALNIKINSDIYIIKANDVIPRVIEAKDNSDSIDIEPPCKCPICGGNISMKNNVLYCINDDCEAKELGKTIKMASRDVLDIENLSKETIIKMMDYCKENNFDYYFTIPFYMPKNIILKLPGFAEKSADNLYNAIKKSKNTTFTKFLMAANIPLVGKSTSEAIVQNFETFEDLVKDIEDDCKILSQIKDIGPKIISNIKKYALDRFSMLINAGIVIVDNESRVIKNNANSLKFVITGAFEISRKEIENIIKSNNHKVSGSVSKNTDYLLASPGEENTTKYKKANELGIPIINSLEELYKLIQ